MVLVIMLVILKSVSSNKSNNGDVGKYNELIAINSEIRKDEQDNLAIYKSLLENPDEELKQIGKMELRRN